METFSWRPDVAPATRQIDSTIDAPRGTSIGPSDLRAEIGLKTSRVDLEARVRTVRIRLTTPSVRVRSFPFLESAAVAPFATADKEERVSAAPSETADRAKTTTRVRPPADVIKLGDRLYYLLQPSLETLIADGGLSFPCEPFPYQLEGVAFLYPRMSAILADEMGLGKTMQAITAMRLLVHRREVRSVLLVCPKPLVANWRREFLQWAPELPLSVVEGDQARRRWQWQEIETPLKIANYELLVRDREVFELADLKFDLVVLDEAQRIKNHGGATAQVARSISRRRSWALTGTPVENSPDDLVGIFEFLAPGTLNCQMKPRTMARVVGDHILRRTKAQVLTQLPPKLIRDAELDLTPEQRASYDLAENEGVLRLTEMGDEVTIRHVFELVLRLKQICNFDPATGASSKLERLLADLEEVSASGQKAIVFSQWVQTLFALRKPLAHLHPLEYHGQVAANQRERVLARFREDRRAHVLLMSYGAGAVGLNLQFAEYVFLFDRWWNPAVEDQAINRAHRIGAVGPVTVTRFLSLATIEERIEQILGRKRELFDTILSEAGPASTGLTQNELFGLFKLPARARSHSA
ncbi:MAG: DEAD/DEAH box helicase [Pirellulales bacterium]